jgi:L-lactate dehydrogenase (cytochrome)
MKIITNIEDLRRLAEKRVPKMFYDYADSGSWTEQTYRENSEDFKKIKLRQRVATNISNRSTQTKMLGVSVSLPTALAPCGMTGMQRADGEILAAKAAEKFNVPFTMSTLSICSIEDVAERVNAPFWFQLYVMKDKKYSENLINRAKAAGCSALMLTLDLQLMGQRHKDIKNGLSAPPKINSVNTLINLALRPKWCFEMLQTRRRSFRNVVGHVDGVSDLSSLSAWVGEAFDLQFTWDDIERIKDLWGGKLILKGILDEEDAQMAVKSGADALIVSNHGGRQLDGTSSSISMLSSIAQSVGQDIEVWVDGGIRSGQDILKSVALGASGTLIGRPYLYGLGALGGEGVTKCLEILSKELDLSMALCGHTDINAVTKDIIKSINF